MAWKHWSGHLAVRSYDTTHDLEYFTIRHATAVIDVSPLFKYDLRGPDAAAFLSRLTVRDLTTLKVGRVTYLCWCDDDGMVIDDGTVTRLGEDHYRLTAAEPSLSWLHRHKRGYELDIIDTTAELGVLAVQGPTSRGALAACVDGPIESLGFFAMTEGTVAGRPVTVTRTGYTGDLGYELWCAAGDAALVWDSLMEGGRAFRAAPVGLDAMDVSRIEAGFIMNGVDYHSAHHCLIESRKSTPFEVGLGWTVKLDREPFVGQDALRRWQERGPRVVTAGLVYDWDAFERLFDRVGLPPQVGTAAWRTSVPIYDADTGRQVGYATSGTWSPTLKQNLAIATLEAGSTAADVSLEIEVTVEHQRERCPVRVAAMPFFDPPRKRG